MRYWLFITTFFLFFSSSVYASVVVRPTGTLKVNSSKSNVVDSRVMGFWGFDGPEVNSSIVNDQSRRGLNGTLAGFSDMKAAKQPGRLGQALFFNGADDYVTIGDAAEPGVITLAAWVKPAQVKTGMRIISKKMSGSGAQYALSTSNSSADKFSAVFFSSAPASDACSSTGTPGSYSANKWYFVVATYDGDTCKIYVNGVDVTTVTSDTASGDILNTTSSLRIGAEGGVTPSGFFNGIIDEVRIFSAAFSDVEVMNLYNMGMQSFNINSGKNDRVTNGLVGLWSFDGSDMITNVADGSGRGNPGFMKNFSATSSVALPGKIGQSLWFDGVNDFVNIPGLSYSISTGDFTASAWINPKNTSTELAFATDFVNGNNFWLGKSSSASFSINGSTVSGGSIQTNKWQHVVGVRRTGNMYVYLNGVLVGGPTAAAGAITTTGYAIGDFGATGNQSYFSGGIDDVRLYGKALSTTEITQLYNLGR